MSVYSKWGVLSDTKSSLSSNSSSSTSPLLAKGDIFVNNGSNDTRQVVGSDGQILMADSSTGNGLRYVSVSGATGINVISSGATGINVSINTDVVTLNGNQTVSNKKLVDTATTIVNAVDPTKTLSFQTQDSTTGISTIVRAFSSTNRIITLPNATTTLLGDNNTTAMSNKTIDSGLNTLTITNSPLSATNVNTLFNQALLTTSSPTFRVITSTNAGGGSMAINPGGITGTMNLTSVQTANRNVIFPDIAGNVVIDSGAQTLTGKTIDSASNTLTITNSPLSATNVNMLLNQALLTTSSPTFVAVTLQTTGGTPTALNYYEEGSFNLTFTGPFTTTVSCNFVRVGKSVNFNMNWSTNVASTGTFFTTSSLPARLAPAIAVDTQIWVMDNSAWLTTPGRILVSGTSISVYKANQTTAFTASGTAAFGNWSWTWRV